MALSLVGAVQALRLWEWRPGMPMGLGGDSTFFTVQVGELMGAGTMDGSHRLGAPFGQNIAWFPSDDQVHYAVVHLLALFSDSPVTVISLYFLLTFPASALTAFLFLRSVPVSRTAAVVGSVLFALMPGHQTKFEHIWLAGYWVLPLGLWLVLNVGLSRPLFARVAWGGGWRGLVRSLLPSARTLMVVIFVGCGGVYYLAFTLILTVVVLVIRWLNGDRRALLGPGMATLGMLTVATTAIATSSRGRAADLITGNPAAERSPAESEYFAGKFMDLLLPWYQHRLEPLRFVTTAYGLGADVTVEHPALGVVALAGLLGLLYTGARVLVLRGPRPAQTLVLLSLLALVSLALYTKGGLGSFIALFLTPQLRTWSRVYLVLGLLGLAGVAWWLTCLQRRVGSGRIAPLAGLILLVGVLDQTNPAAAPDYAAMDARVQSTRAFTADLDRTLPHGCSVFQLPVVQFPESPPPNAMKDYDHLLPYLTSRNLRWSYGALKGTSRADWQLALPTSNVTVLVQDLAAVGFCAIEVDRAGFSAASDPIFDLERLLGPAISATKDHRLVAYDLRNERERVLGTTAAAGRANQVLRPVVVQVGGYPPDPDAPNADRWVGPRSSLIIGNMTGREQQLNLSLDLAAPTDRPWSVTVSGQGAVSQQVLLQPSATRTIHLSVVAPVGRSVVDISSSVDRTARLQDGRVVSGRLGDVQVQAEDSRIRAIVAKEPEPPRP